MALPLYNELPLIADLEEEEQDTQMTSSETLQPKPGVRHLPLEGAYNIRDLGGYTTTDDERRDGDSTFVPTHWQTCRKNLPAPWLSMESVTLSTYDAAQRCNSSQVPLSAVKR